MESLVALLIGGLAMGLAWLGALALLAAGGRSAVNRRAALILVVEGVSAVVVPFFLFQAESAATPETGNVVGDVFAAAIVFVLLLAVGFLLLLGTLLLLVPLYLALLGTLDTPLAAPVRTRARRVLVVLGLAALVGLGLAAGPQAAPFAIGAVLLATPAYGLAVCISAWSRAPQGTAERSRLRALALAFGTRDVAWLALVAGLAAVAAVDGGGDVVQALLFVVWPVATIAFVALLAYALLPTHAPTGREPKLRRGIRLYAPSGTLLLCAATLTTFAAGEVRDRFGVWAGVVAALIAAALADRFMRSREKLRQAQPAEEPVPTG